MRDKTAGGAIIRQLVCGRYCYLMLMPLDPIDTCVRDGTKNRFQLRNGEVRHGCVPFSATPANTGVVHEEADSGMLRVLIRCTVRVRSNLSGMYHRAVESRGQEGEPATRDRRRMNEGQGRRGKKSLYRATVAPRGVAPASSPRKNCKAHQFCFHSSRNLYFCGLNRTTAMIHKRSYFDILLMRPVFRLVVTSEHWVFMRCVLWRMNWFTKIFNPFLS